MEQNSPVGTKAEKNNLIVGALILFIGIVIGGVFGGGVLNSVDDANLQGQAIESQEVTQSDSGKAQWSDVQIDALKNIKEVHIVTGTEEDLKTAYNIDVNILKNKSPENNEEKIAELKSLGIILNNPNPNPNPDLPSLVCFYMSNYNTFDSTTGLFNFWDTWPSNCSWDGSTFL
jgi:hypothetical protein